LKGAENVHRRIGGTDLRQIQPSGDVTARASDRGSFGTAWKRQLDAEVAKKMTRLPNKK
jgi:hypothetical protein